MANVNVLRHADSGLVGKFTAYLAEYRAARKRHNVYRETLAELNALSDRDLADMGMSRFMLDEVAREAAYGK
ncbi:MAG: DUF1127 domain-containing protein [Pseudomonadota bacterium]